ncbi:MAG: glutathione S-transferase [Aquisalinus sp.]|nr:glutathione S-transferase [Aquisalinus sp.]
MTKRKQSQSLRQIINCDLMKLTATPKSHFSRKIRLLLDHLGLPYQLDDPGNVADIDKEIFGGNPLMSVPVLSDRQQVVFESDNIARYLVRKFDPKDTYDVLTENAELLNLRAVMNGIMENDVKLILSARTGMEPDDYPYFQKAKQVIIAGLVWLEKRGQCFAENEITYTDFHLISMWDHLRFYDFVELDFPLLLSATEKLSQSNLVRRSAPQS